MIGTFREILSGAINTGGAKRAVVVLPGRRHCEVLNEAARAGLVCPILVGDGTVLGGSGSGALPDCRVIHEPESSRALALSRELVRNGEADILIQGDVDQQAFVDGMADAERGLMNGRVMSHVSLFELPERNRLILVTDTYMRDQPTVVEKQWILENVLSLASVLEIERPKVAVLAAIEQVNPAITSTMDAAVLSKMAHRRQFGDIVLEGPLDIDCALNREAAARKGVHSEVTGNADIYLVPEVDTGYSLAQMLMYVGGLPMVGATLGTLCPVVLDLPFMSQDSKVIEIALAVLMAARGTNHG